MQVEAQDYVVVSLSKGMALGRVLKVGKKAVKTKVYNKDGTTMDVLEIDPQHVRVNYGPKLEGGARVGSAVVEPKRKSLTSDLFESVSVHRSTTKAEAEELQDAVDSFASAVRKRKLDRGYAIDLQIRPGSSTAGRYFYRPKEETDVIHIRPQELGTPESKSLLRYTLAHEYGHAVWAHSVGAKQRYVWIELYHEAVQVETSQVMELEGLLHDLEEAGGTSALARDLEPELRPLFRQCLSHIKRVHHLDSKHVDLALLNGRDLRDLWPARVDLGTSSVIVSEYARKSVEELFAEAFALWFVGSKLPQKVSAALTTTLSKLKD